MELGSFLQQLACGAIAAAAFGVLFNVRFRTLPWCAASGALALAVRTSCLGLGSSLEGASFVAAVAVGAMVELLSKRRGIPQEVLDVVGCIPMIPGSFATKAIVGLIAVTTSAVQNESDMLFTATQYSLRVLFITGAIGTGLAIPGLVLRLFKSRQALAPQTR